MGVAVTIRSWMDPVLLLSLPQAYRPIAIAAVGTPTIKARRNMCEAPMSLFQCLLWPRGLWGRARTRMRTVQRPFFRSERIGTLTYERYKTVCFRWGYVQI